MGHFEYFFHPKTDRGESFAVAVERNLQDSFMLLEVDSARDGCARLEAKNRGLVTSSHARTRYGNFEMST